MLDNYFEYPVWTRSIELDQEIREYKIDITQFLIYFEYYLSEIVDENKDAVINLISTPIGLDLQVITVDFSEEEVNNKYQEYISFLAEPELLKKIISNLKKSFLNDENELTLAVLNKFLKIRKEVKSLQDNLSESVEDNLTNDNPKILKQEIFNLKNKILASLTETEILTKDKQYFQEVIKNFSQQKINLLSTKFIQQTHENTINNNIMSQQNFQNSNINNSGNMNFGQNYSNMISEARQKIVDMVLPTDKLEDKLIQIQGYLQEILELIITNQEIPEAQKEVAIKAVSRIAQTTTHSPELDPNHTGIVQTALETISSVFNGVSNAITNLETIKNLAGILGLKI